MASILCADADADANPNDCGQRMTATSPSFYIINITACCLLPAATPTRSLADCFCVAARERLGMQIMSHSLLRFTSQSAPNVANCSCCMSASGWLNCIVLTWPLCVPAQMVWLFSCLCCCCPPLLWRLAALPPFAVQFGALNKGFLVLMKIVAWFVSNSRHFFLLLCSL